MELEIVNWIKWNIKEEISSPYGGGILNCYAVSLWGIKIGS